MRAHVNTGGRASAAILAGLLSTGLSAPGAAAREQLRGEEIRQLVANNRIYLATPLGGELPMNYRAGGDVDASGEAIGLGRFFRPKDQGRWWISGDTLCQQWQNWYDGQRICFRLERVGANQLIWTRDNGERGKARFAPR
jgi:hypothetical protein